MIRDGFILSQAFFSEGVGVARSCKGHEFRQVGGSTDQMNLAENGWPHSKMHWEKKMSHLVGHVFLIAFWTTSSKRMRSIEPWHALTSIFHQHPPYLGLELIWISRFTALRFRHLPERPAWAARGSMRPVSERSPVITWTSNDIEVGIVGGAKLSITGSVCGRPTFFLASYSFQLILGIPSRKF